MITQRGGEIANAFSGFNVSVYGFKLGFAGLAAFEFGVAIYAIVQGYGFWKLEAWGWWLYIIADIITLILGVFFLVESTWQYVCADWCNCGHNCKFSSLMVSRYKTQAFQGEAASHRRLSAY